MVNREVRCSENNICMRATDDEKMIIEGYAVVFNSPATHGFTEIISETAFNNTDMTDVVLRYNHQDSFMCLARTRNKTLELIVDEKGLKIKAQLNPKINEHKSIYEGIRSGLLDKMSFCFDVRGEEYDYDTNTYTIKDISKLYDVAVVDQPFYDSTSIFARSLDKTKQKIDGLRNVHEAEKQANIEKIKSSLLEKLG